MMTILCNSDDYYKIIGSPGTQILVLGENGEQWTEEVRKVLDLRQIGYHFLPWHALEDVRLQSEMVYYPVIQVWLDGNLKGELVGYQSEDLGNLLAKTFSKRKKG